MAKLTKDWFRSRTLWIAILEGLIGVGGALASDSPTIQLGSLLLALEGLKNFLLRLDTTTRLIK